MAKEKNTNSVKTVSIHVPMAMYEAIEHFRQARGFKPKRTKQAYVLEALEEKLRQDEKNER